MKEIEFNSICEKLKLDKFTEEIKIKKVVTDVSQIDNNTLVFNLKKINELDIEKFKKLKNCFIITDQPLITRPHQIHKNIIYVVDVEKVYQKFIAFYRGLFHFPVIAITGTCGKTTTKEIIKQALEKNFKVVSTYLSKNALRFSHDYLMRFDDSTNYGVFETAITHPGHLIYNCNFFRPNIGVITNIGIDHLNVCKTIDNYIRTKGEMLAGLQYKGVLVINGDDENIKKIDLTPFKGKVMTFGLGQQNDFTATNIHYNKKGITFTVHHNKAHYYAYIPGFGRHNVYNALAALVVLYSLGFKLEEAIVLLKDYKPVTSHTEFHQGINDSIIVDDTWSSNPTSLNAAFEVFQGNFKRRIAVIGKIAYLGNHETNQCKEIGKLVAKSNIDYLITIDEFSKQIGLAALQHGMNLNQIINCNGESEIKTKLSRLLEPGTIVLFKTSMLDKSFINTMKYFIKIKS